MPKSSVNVKHKAVTYVLNWSVANKIFNDSLSKIPPVQSLTVSVIFAYLVSDMEAGKKIIPQYFWGSIVVLLIIGAVLRFFNLDFAPGTHPDERHMVSVAQGLSLTNLNPKSFAYGSFSYYIVWLVSSFLGNFWPKLSSYDGVFLVGRSICALFGLASVLGTVLLARKAFCNDLLALLAGFLLCLNYFHIQLSRYFTSDIILTALSLFAILAMLKLLESKSPRWLILCGALVGLSIATKISALILVVPLGVALLARAIGDKGHTTKSLLTGSLLSFLFIVIFFLLAEPYALLDFQKFLADNREQTSMVRGLWRPPYTIQYANTTPYLYHLEQMANYTFGWPTFLATMLGLFLTTFRFLRTKKIEALVILVWVLAFFASTAGMQVKFPRYLLPIYPELCIFGALFLVSLLDGASKCVAHQDFCGVNEPPLAANSFPSLTSSSYSFLANAKAYAMSYSPWLCGGISLIGICVMPIMVASSASAYTLFLIWVAMWLSLAAALFLVDQRKGISFCPKRWLTPSDIGILSLILIGAFLLRSVGLDEVPARFLNDEMNYGLNALNFLGNKSQSLFGLGWLGEGNLGYFLSSLSLSIFGQNIWGLRLGSAIFGTFSILGLYVLTRCFSGRGIALVSALLLATNHWHIHYSRVGFHVVLISALVVWSVALLALALQKRSLGYGALSGVLTAMALLVGNFSHYVVLINLTFIASVLIWEGRKQATALSSLAWIGGLVVGFLPSFCQADALWLTLFGQYQNLFIFAEQNARHVYSSVGSLGTLDIISYQAKQLLLFFTSGKDASPQYGLSGMFMDPFLYCFLVAGMILSLTKTFRDYGSILWTWFASVVVLYGICTIDSPSSPRLFGLSYVIAVFMAMALVSLWGWLHENLGQLRNLSYFLIASIIGLSAWWNYYHYFNTYTARNRGEISDSVIRLVTIKPEIATVINLTTEPINFNHEAWRFIAPKIIGYNVIDSANPAPELSGLWSAVKLPVLFVSPMERPALTLLADKITTNQIGSEPGTKKTKGFLWYVVP